MPAKIEYTRDRFRETARRRISEARSLLDAQKRFCDGATTCALLAAECALKAALLHGLGIEETGAAPEATRKSAFETKKGHDLSQLWNLQEPSIKAKKTTDLGAAIDQLHQLDRYEHRYGARRPDRVEAGKAVDAAEKVVAWMTKEVV